LSWADPAPTPNTNAPAPIAQQMTPNPAATPFLQSHPELTTPSPGDATLRPRASTTPPEVAPAESDSLLHSGPETGPDSTLGPAPEDVSGDLAAHLLVVYNAKDPDSQSLAEYYAGRRNIPPERIFAITAPTSEEITRAQFDDTVRVPIVSYLCQKDWMEREMRKVRVGDHFLDLLVATRNDIWAIVLMRGVPLKIAPDPSDPDSMENQPELRTDAAAVDNELALLPIYGLPLGGYVPNLFFDGQVSGIHSIGPELARNIVLVTRLDGPTPADVRRMIDDSIAAENERLAGLAVVDSRGFKDLNNGYTSGDVWMRGARDALVEDGMPVRFDDNPDVIPPTDPCNHVAFYVGWYHEGAYGPWIIAPNRFVPGAFAYHLHSYSAATVRSDTAGWVGPLIAHGADATMGMVYEPYLALTPHVDFFTKRLLDGGYFAEAAYASEGALSWMLTVVGDPLYRPFRRSLDSALADAAPRHTPHDDWLLLQKVRREILLGQISGDADSLKQALDVPGIGAVAEEGLGDLLVERKEGSAEMVDSAYHRAMDLDSLPIDRIRLGLKLAEFYSAHGHEALAQSELEWLRTNYPIDAQRFGIASPMVPTSVPPPAKAKP
jgi:uncharacterized protein (TIGR03790 family)